MNIKAKSIITFLTFLSLLPAAVNADELRLKNGDRLSGQVVRMEEKKLTFKTSYAGEISVKWQEVANLQTNKPIKIVLSDETTLKGKPKPAEEGKMKIKMGKIVETVSFNLAEVKAINPKPKVTEPPVKMKGHVNVGLTSTRGNTETSTHHMDGEFVARTVKNRYTLGAEINRAEDDGEKTVNNVRGYAKYDHFLTEKWFLYSSASAEKNEFKDLNLRTDLGIGAGYQFFETPMMNLSLETGLAYVNEDYDEGQDNDYPAGRWAVNFDKYFFNKTLQFFHFHEGFVGLEDTDDLFIRSRTGLTVPIYKKFKATAQYKYDWDKNPKQGREKADEMYILTLGYEW
jgi:putative salt-induced outer membrane protein YdiY